VICDCRQIRDPRFDDLSGKFNQDRFRKQYAFLYDEQLPAERQAIKGALQVSLWASTCQTARSIIVHIPCRIARQVVNYSIAVLVASAENQGSPEAEGAGGAVDSSAAANQRRALQAKKGGMGTGAEGNQHLKTQMLSIARHKVLRLPACVVI
jgi:hypothetical protein